MDEVIATSCQTHGQVSLRSAHGWIHWRVVLLPLPHTNLRNRTTEIRRSVDLLPHTGRFERVSPRRVPVVGAVPRSMNQPATNSDHCAWFVLYRRRSYRWH